MSNASINYYAVLEINPKATQQQIRDAYKRAALKHHPDRVPANSPERGRRTRKFQQVNDAYYVLSDPGRRREYDAARLYQGFSPSSSSTTSTDIPDPEEEEIPRPPPSSTGQKQSTGAFGGFPWSAFGFGNNNNNAGTSSDGEKFSNEQFGSVFEEMLREQGMAEGGATPKPTGKFWSVVGGASGGAMGFIFANFPGAVAGAVAGNRVGAIRDARGKSVYSVFQELPQSDKAKLLSELAAKVFSHAVGTS